MVWVAVVVACVASVARKLYTTPDLDEQQVGDCERQNEHMDSRVERHRPLCSVDNLGAVP